MNAGDDLDEADSQLVFGLRPFFQIPVYAESRDTYHAWLRSKLSPHGDASVAMGESRERGEALARHSVGTTWPYNRVVGWIELHAARDVIKAYLTWTSQKQIRRARRDAFNLCHTSRIFECWLHDEMTSSDVFGVLSESLIKAGRKSPITGHWIDRSAFDSVGPHVDFPAMLGWSERSADRASRPSHDG